MTPLPAIVGLIALPPDVFQAPKLEPWIVRYELSDSEWATIKQLLPNKSRNRWGDHEAD